MAVRRQKRSLPALWAPSLARRLVRHRLVHAVVLAMVGFGAAASLSATSAAYERQRDEWGELVTVAVVQEPVAVGQPVVGAVALTQVPRAMTPPGAAAQVAPDSLAKVALYPGEIVLKERISGPGAGERQLSTAALTLPVTVQLPLLNQGDLVDLWIVDGGALSSHRAVERVVVLAFSERDITVAVPHDQLERATAASMRPVIVTRIG